ncbi:MAG: electron transfer flavoprotein subunit alpha/FixB family protein [Cytophagales bacterium]|mgnify:FL=1|tara:strand:+ start:9721 stop:10635 length:915 start_codon:yes stop_codon:yes gene_type:complete
MNGFIIIEANNKKIKDSSLECVYLANKISQKVIVISDIKDEKILKDLPVDVFIIIDDIDNVDSYSNHILNYKNNFFLLPDSLRLKKVSAKISKIFNIPVVSNIIDLSVKINIFNCKASIFNNNVISDIEVSRDGCIFIIKKYTIDPIPKGNRDQEFIYLKSENINLIKVKVLEKIKMSNDKPLSEAKVVVSAGRGLKSSENWEMVEKLAKLLNAATACSKPVSDLGWRPHSEHVGQTGIKISPDIYIAIGISGAIQHIAGVNSSKKILVINIDPEAPFFKHADYGIIGDAFEIIPNFIKYLKND